MCKKWIFSVSTLFSAGVSASSSVLLIHSTFPCVLTMTNHSTHSVQRRPLSSLCVHVGPCGYAFVKIDVRCMHQAPEVFFIGYSCLVTISQCSLSAIATHVYRVHACLSILKEVVKIEDGKRLEDETRKLPRMVVQFCTFIAH